CNINCPEDRVSSLSYCSLGEMFKTLKELFDGRLKGELHDSNPRIAEHALRIATSALLVEISRSDYEFDLIERDKIQDIISTRYGLTTEETKELLVIAEAEVDASISLDQFTVLLDRDLVPDQKIVLLEMLWEVAFADGRIDKYEEYLIRKLADLLHVPHRGFIQAKLKVQSRRDR
ncbi:MAG: TerB family tellurite resistance protein, partial [Candidatus Sedimenticola sp. 6PFRAG7]